MIFVINFPFCNYHSLTRYLSVNSLEFESAVQDASFSRGDIVILPGVGTFRQGMEYLEETGIGTKLKRHARTGGKIIGICLGMQLLLEKSDESPNVGGLSLISGDCKKIRSSKEFLVPHIGWNRIRMKELGSSDYGGIGQCGDSYSDYYFVHSYHADTLSKEETVATFRHPDGDLAAIIAKENIVGMQFHPEKSGPAGYKLLNHFLR